MKMKINLDKENPLKTILNFGKIPVVRRSNDGFKNYNQEDYFESRKKNLSLYKDVKGCFCHIGGIQGMYISGGHYGEKLNIGYIDPNEKVFCTYTSNNKKDFSYMTASERFYEGMLSFSLFDSSIYDLDDFDLETEAIVDASKITPICEIEEKDFCKLTRFVDDGFLRLFSLESLYNVCIESLPDEFFSLIGINDRKSYLDDFYELPENDKRKPFIRALVMEFFISYSLGGNYLKNSNKIIEYRKKEKEMNEFIKNFYSFKGRYTKFSLDAILTEEYMNISLLNRYGSYLSKIERETIKLDSRKKDLEIYEEIFDKKESPLSTKTIGRTLPIDSRFSRKNLFILFDFLLIYDKYVELFGDFVNVFYDPIIDKIRFYKKIYDKLSSEKYNFSFDDNLELLTINIGEYITIEYNFILKDSVIAINKDEIEYFNIEKMGFKYKEEERIVREVLSSLIIFTKYSANNIESLF